MYISLIRLNVSLIIYIAIIFSKQWITCYELNTSHGNLILQSDIILRYRNYKQIHSLRLYDSNIVTPKQQVDTLCVQYNLSVISCDYIQQDIVIRINKVNKTPKIAMNEIQSINTIWILWWQGWDDQTPPIVLKCYDSWRHHHSPLKWNIILLDKHNIHNFLNLTKVVSESVIHIMSRAALSDVIRWMLMYEFGGVWVDATVFCHKPLSSWLNLTYIKKSSHNNATIHQHHSTLNEKELYVTFNQTHQCSYDGSNCRLTHMNFTTTGFYSIADKAPMEFVYIDVTYMYNAWFLVSIKHGYIASQMVNAIRDYWYKRDKEHNYFWINLLFIDLYNNDEHFSQLWDAVDTPDGPEYYHYNSRYLYLRGLLNERITEDARQWLREPDAYISKLSFKSLITNNNNNNSNSANAYTSTASPDITVSHLQNLQTQCQHITKHEHTDVEVCESESTQQTVYEYLVMTYQFE